MTKPEPLKGKVWYAPFFGKHPEKPRPFVFLDDVKSAVEWLLKIIEENKISYPPHTIIPFPSIQCDVCGATLTLRNTFYAVGEKNLCLKCLIKIALEDAVKGGDE